MRIPRFYLKDFPYLLVQEGKHDNSYFLIHSEEELHKACRRVFDNHYGYYYGFPSERGEAEREASIAKHKVEQLNAAVEQLTVPEIKEDFQNQLRTAKAKFKEKLDALIEIDLIEKIKNGDPDKECTAFVLSRSYYEYEKLSREAFEKL